MFAVCNTVFGLLKVNVKNHILAKLSDDKLNCHAKLLIQDPGATRQGVAANKRSVATLVSRSSGLPYVSGSNRCARVTYPLIRRGDE